MPDVPVGSDSIDQIIEALTAQGSPTQVQWADRQTGWGEGAIIARRDGKAIVLTQLGRVEAEDRTQRFDSESEAASDLRRRLLDRHVRRMTPEERELVEEQARREAEDVRARLHGRGPGA